MTLTTGDPQTVDHSRHHAQKACSQFGRPQELGTVHAPRACVACANTNAESGLPQRCRVTAGYGAWWDFSAAILGPRIGVRVVHQRALGQVGPERPKVATYAVDVADRPLARRP